MEEILTEYEEALVLHEMEVRVESLRGEDKSESLVSAEKALQDATRQVRRPWRMHSSTTPTTRPLAPRRQR